MAQLAQPNTGTARTLVGAAALAVALGGTLAGCKDPTVGAATGSATPPGTSAPGAPGGAKGSALAAVGGLTVKGRAPKTGYSRDRFGAAWSDTDHNHCDTRVISMLRRLVDTLSQITPGVACYA